MEPAWKNGGGAGPSKISTLFAFASRRLKLCGRGRSGSAVQRKGIARRNVWRERRKSGDQLGSGYKVQSSRGQRGHVQRLADVASDFRAIRVLVKQAPARGEI